MSEPISYQPSRLSPDEHFLRERSFTRWMSLDLLQAANDFGKNIGQLPIYIEHGTDQRVRFLPWHPPENSGYEIRSGREKMKFEAFDRVNRERNWLLLSLHINEQQIYSAVWITSEHYDIAVQVLGAYGISPAKHLAE